MIKTSPNNNLGPKAFRMRRFWHYAKWFIIAGILCPQVNVLIWLWAGTICLLIVTIFFLVFQMWRQRILGHHILIASETAFWVMMITCFFQIISLKVSADGTLPWFVASLDTALRWQSPAVSLLALVAGFLLLYPACRKIGFHQILLRYPVSENSNFNEIKSNLDEASRYIYPFQETGQSYVRQNPPIFVVLLPMFSLVSLGLFVCLTIVWLSGRAMSPIFGLGSLSLASLTAIYSLGVILKQATS